jgi:aryl-alcohol dehydrogenase-like predicted oxidoreductase
MYSDGLSEVILGKAIKQLNLPRDEIVIMTKLFFVVGAEWSLPNPDECGFVNQHGLSRKHIFDSVKRSLERLQLDYVDVLQCELFVHLTCPLNLRFLKGHRFDRETPIEETVRMIDHELPEILYISPDASLA